MIIRYQSPIEGHLHAVSLASLHQPTTISIFDTILDVYGMLWRLCGKRSSMAWACGRNRV